MHTSMASILFLLCAIAVSLCIAQVEHEKHLYARKEGGRMCRHRLYDASPFEPEAPLKTLPGSFDFLTYVFPKSPRDSRNMAWVRNTLAFYALCVDGKDFDSLDRVFTIDGRLNMGQGRQTATSLPLVQKTLRRAFHGLSTHHQLGQENIKFFDHHCQAHTVTYFTATISDTRNGSTKVVTTVGQYQDSWFKVFTGEWRIVQRNVIYMGPPIGDASILQD